MSKMRARTWEAMSRGWANRCPQCGEGEIWRRDGNIHQRCANCNLAFEPDQADWGAFTWAFGVEVALVVIAASVVELFFDLPYTTHVYLWSAAVVLFHFAFYRRLKGQWIGLRTAMTGRPDNRV